MHQGQPQQQEPLANLRSLLGWLVFISRIGAVSVEVFLRKGFGIRYIGLQAALVLIAIPLWASCFEGQDVSHLMYFLYAYLGMVLVARTNVVYRWFRGDSTHSYYNGTPRIGRMFRFLSEMTVKKAIEPLLVFGVGVLFCPASEPLGSYLMFAACCLFFSAGTTDLAMRKRTRDLQDALIEQQYVVDQFRGPNGRW